jgi:putative ABC transport system permease protein
MTMRIDTAWIDGCYKDLRYAVHSLVTQPAFSAMALLALVVGIALNVGVFTAINAIWTRPWNVPEPERVVNAYAFNPKAGAGYWGFSLASARFLNDNSRTIEGAFAERDKRVRVVAGGAEAGANASFVTGNYFDVLDVAVEPGRGFRADEDNAAAPVAVAVISYWLWTERYGADPGVIGQSVLVDGVPFTVVGVADERFPGVDEERMDVWLPFAALQLVQPTGPELFADPTHCCSGMAARLRPGVSREQAAAELNTLYAQFMRELGVEPAEIVLTGTAMLDHPERRQQAAAPLALALAAFGAVLLLACANVTNLLLARAAARQSEIALRMAIGAGRRRIVRQLLIEAAVLAAAAVALSLPLAYVLPGAALRLMGQTLPTGLSFAPDGNVLVYAVGLALLCTVAFGLAPALQATRADLIGAIKGRGTATARRSRLRGVSLGAQVAVSVALLVAAGLLVRGVEFARNVDFGFRIDGVSAVAVTLPPNVYAPEAEAGLFDTVVSRLDSTEPVGVSFLMPLGERHEFAGAGCADATFVRTHMVTPGFFDVLRIPFVDGRNMSPADAPRNAVVVNEAFARLCSPGQSLAGQTQSIGGRQLEIVGVVRDAQLHGTGGVDPIVFMPFAPGPVFRGEAVLLLPASLAERAAGIVRGLDPRATAEVVEMREQVERWLGDSAGLARMAGTIGLLALLLAAVGIYGVFSYYVEQRRREIGVRIALGARPGQVIALVVRQNAPALLGGLAAGLLIAVGESIVLRGELHGLSSADPFAYLGVLLVMLLTGIAASVLPARRAARTDPNSVLHYE